MCLLTQHKKSECPPPDPKVDWQGRRPQIGHQLFDELPRLVFDPGSSLGVTIGRTKFGNFERVRGPRIHWEFIVNFLLKLDFFVLMTLDKLQNLLETIQRRYDRSEHVRTWLWS